MSPRPAVDVVVPFRGSAAQLDQLAARLGTLALRDGDSVTIADNRPGAAEAQRGAVRIIAASERQTSYHARNRGADTNRAPWLVFVDRSAGYVAPPVPRPAAPAAPRPAPSVAAGSAAPRPPRPAPSTTAPSESSAGEAPLPDYSSPPMPSPPAPHAPSSRGAPPNR